MEFMKTRHFILLLLTLTPLLFAVGCRSFPDGKPPAHEVVPSYDPTPRSVATAITEQSNNLIAFGLARLGGKKVQLDAIADAALRRDSERVLRASANIIRFHIVPANADYIVHSVRTEVSPGLVRWEMSLAPAAEPEKVLWRQCVNVDTDL